MRKPVYIVEYNNATVTKWTEDSERFDSYHEARKAVQTFQPQTRYRIFELRYLEEGTT
jgi:hypothetical protein